MKSRKLGFFGTRRELRRTANSKCKAFLRKGLVESLEKREMLAADWNPALVASTGLFYNAQGRANVMSYVNAQANGLGTFGSTASSPRPEGGPDDIISVAEIEPNNGFSRAQLIPLAGNFGVNVIGSNVNLLDEDWYAFDLAAGDILDVRLTSNAGVTPNLPLLSLYNASNREMVATQTVPTAPAVSPLTGSPSSPINLGDIALHYVIPTAGRYYSRVSDVLSTYTLQFRKYRPVLESAPVGTVQKIFLDFDGAVVSRSIFGVGPGSARMSPLSTYLADYGIQDVDENAFIDEVVRRVQNKFDTLGARSNNPNFGVQILNSKDHADPWGEENVSRIIIGGTWQDLVGDPDATNDIGILGIAQSVDAGNFDLKESAIVMNDVLIATVNAVNITASAPRLNAIAELMTFVIAHEAGHFLGGWHQNPNNATNVLMDQFYEPTVSSGAGPDGIFGTVDDRPIHFGIDGFATGGGPFEGGGINDTIAFLGWGLTGGTSGGFVTGTTFHDRNVNRAFDSADARLPGIRVYSDANNDGVYTAGEQFTFSNANGDYRLVVTPGNHVIRQETLPGFVVNTPVNNGHVLTVGLGATAANRHFGNEAVNQAITGIKWSDTNGNGLRDPGEPGIGGVWIYIDLDGDNRIDLGEPSTQTAADGTYKLNFPGPGTYQVREVIDPGYVQTFPGVSDDANPLNDYEHEVVITGNPVIDAARITNLNFGNRLTVDFGDAPASYGVASHGFVEGLRLGDLWDAEPASQFSSNALGDDNNGVDDEDGVALARPLVRGSNNNQLTVDAVNTTGNTAYVNVWIDFNQDGDFLDVGEHVAQNFAVAAGAAVPSTVRFAAPSNALLGDSFVRVRLSSTPNIGPTGAAAAGEVEDYLMTVVATLDLAVDDNFTVSRNATQQPLDVLANDFKLPGELVRVVAHSSSSAGGTIQIAQNGQSILYTPPAQFVGQDVFTYTYENSGGERDTATVVVDVRLVFADPLAIDDSFNVATNAVAIPLNVLANDIEGPGGALSILSVTQPDKGGQITIGPGGKSLLYTPPRGFGGTEFLTYLAGDATGEQSTARVTLHTLPGAQQDDDVLIQLVATDLSGNPISAIQQGQNFKIEVKVDDLRFDAANPGTAAGVFAAYFDLLYSMQLVSTLPGAAGSSFNFAVDFADPYTAVRRGNADIPGIINEFGAVSNLTLMNNPNPLTLATITFAARSPGIANFMPDPAEDVPFSDTLLFDVPGSAVPKERIRFVGTSLEIVGDGIQFPVAIDDSVSASSGVATSINVMANDLRGSTRAISIVGSTSGSRGSTMLDTRGTPDPSDDRIVYTSNTGFVGVDQFTYTIADARGIQSTATVTVRVGDPVADVNFRIAVTDLNGQPIDEVVVGSQFLVTGFVQDLRPAGDNRGIFAAYQDILYSSQLVRPVASSTNDPNLGFQVSFGPDYNRIRSGDIRNAGIINEIGAVATLDTPTGSGELRLFSVTMTANAVGQASFIGDPADILPLHDTLTYEPVQPVSFNRIRYGSDTVNIVTTSGAGGNGEGYTNWLNPMDVNADGFVSPIDVLSVINMLNARGSGTLSTGGGEGEDRLYVDTNADGMLSPIDVLGVVNYLNQKLRMSGEGEVASSPAVNLSAPMIQATELTSTSSVQSPMELTELISSQQQTPASRSIGARPTSQNYGPATYISATDSVFAEDEDDFESLLDSFAPGIEETLKKRSSL